MVKVEDLRRGNIVRIGGQYVKIDAVLEDAVLVNQAAYPLSGIGPVVLNREVLSSCGFEVTYSLIEYPLKRLFPFLLKESAEGSGYSLLFDYKRITGKEFLFLHELQNLYFAFSGKELPVGL